MHSNDFLKITKKFYMDQLQNNKYYQSKFIINSLILVKQKFCN